MINDITSYFRFNLSQQLNTGNHEDIHLPSEIETVSHLDQRLGLHDLSTQPSSPSSFLTIKISTV